MSDAFKAEKMADDPEFDNIWNLAARWHLKFMKGANAQLNSGNVDFRTPHYIKTFHEIKRFGNVEPDADDCKPVKEAYDAFMKRLKKVVNDNVNYRNLLKEIDEYVAPSAVPPIAEEFFWKNGWGATEQVIVQNLSKFYAPINVNGVFRIKHKGPDGKDEFFKKEDFINMFRSKCILITVKTATGTKGKSITIAEVFLKAKAPWMGWIFNPDFKWKSDTIYNQWRGWPIKPIKGSFQIWLDYAHDISFNRNDFNTNWGIGWAAQNFLEPHIIKGSAMIHRGVEGIGKSFFAETLEMLMGRHYVKITDLNQLFGPFNAHIEFAMLTHFEEAFWAGDRRAEGQIKDHISGTTPRLINQKNLPMRQCRVYPRSLFDTNARWVVPASMEARRFGIFDVSEARRNDVDYFGKLREWW
jgi:Family of unknown function (DUF5906)